MFNIIIFVLALAPVLSIGVVLVNLLLEGAPRRGKWPLAAGCGSAGHMRSRRPRPAAASRPATSAGAGWALFSRKKKRMTIRTPGGLLLEGTPEQIVARLIEMLARADEEAPDTAGFGRRPPGRPWRDTAEGFLRQLAEAGLISIREDTKPPAAGKEADESR